MEGWVRPYKLGRQFVELALYQWHEAMNFPLAAQSNFNILILLTSLLYK